jgi:hypothetical protein
MIQASSTDSFSAKVRIDLNIAGQCLPVAQAGGGQLIFDTPVALCESDRIGEVVVYIDESPQRWRVRLLPGPTPTRIVSAEFELMP